MERSPLQFLRGKVGIAVLGACLIGGSTAVVIAKSTPSQLAARSSPSSSISQTSATSTSGTVAATATSPSLATATTDSGGDGGQNPPTATPIVFPTRTPRPTATTPVSGQACNLSGGITAISIGANTFTLHHLGVSHTIDVKSSTTFTGSSTTFAGLQVGWTARVNGVTQVDGSCLASSVNSSVDN